MIKNIFEKLRRLSIEELLWLNTFSILVAIEIFLSIYKIRSEKPTATDWLFLLVEFVVCVWGASMMYRNRKK